MSRIENPAIFICLATRATPWSITNHRLTINVKDCLAVGPGSAAGFRTLNYTYR